MSQFVKFYFTSSMPNIFRTFIHPSSGACDSSIEESIEESQAPDDGCVNVRNMLSIEDVK